MYEPQEQNAADSNPRTCSGHREDQNASDEQGELFLFIFDCLMSPTGFEPVLPA